MCSGAILCFTWVCFVILQQSNTSWNWESRCTTWYSGGLTPGKSWVALGRVRVTNVKQCYILCSHRVLCGSSRLSWYPFVVLLISFGSFVSRTVSPVSALCYSIAVMWMLSGGVANVCKSSPQFCDSLMVSDGISVMFLSSRGISYCHLWVHLASIMYPMAFLWRPVIVLGYM